MSGPPGPPAVSVTVVQKVEKEMSLSFRYLVVHDDYSGIIAAFAVYVEMEEIRTFIHRWRNTKDARSNCRLYDTAFEREIEI